mmetsp:Transcript_18260/g.21039  ORF Transcript_18260/g.21039 Transcript_18260/m.21039 type:complete len:266 (+) Transcript_18260:789-1586(+)
MSWLSSCENETTDAGNSVRKNLLLLLFRELVEFSTSETLCGEFAFSEDTDVLSDGLGGFFNITSNHNDTDTGSLASSNRVFNIRSWRVLNSNDTDQDWFSFELGIFVEVLKQFVSLVVMTIVVTENTALFLQANSKGSVSLLGHLVDLSLNLLLVVSSKSSLVAVSQKSLARAVQKIIRGSLNEHNVLLKLFFLADNTHGFSVSCELKNSELLVALRKVLSIILNNATGFRDVFLVLSDLFDQNFQSSFSRKTCSDSSALFSDKS